MWLAVHYVEAAEPPEFPVMGTVLHGPFNTKQEAEEWSDKFLPGAQSTTAYFNSPFFDESMIEMFVKPLVKT
jgi:hypothetical protein